MICRLLSWGSALLLAAGLVAGQILLGGWWYPALAAPGYLLVALGAILAGLAFFGVKHVPGAWCTGTMLAFAGYLLWRQSVSPDSYAAAADTWLTLAVLAVYLTLAWQVGSDGPRALLLAALGALVIVQVFIAVAQFAADRPFHPFPDLSLHMTLPRGAEGGVLGRGWLSGTMASRTALAGVLEVSAFLSLGLLVWGRGGMALKLVLLWITAVAFAGLSISLSRSAYLGVPFGVTAFALLSFFIVRRGARANRGLLAAGALVLVALSLCVGLAAGAESIVVRLRLAELQLDPYREGLWFVSVPPTMDLDRWFGAGANMFDQLSLRYRGAGFGAKPVHAHNDWLQLLVEYGRAGLLLGGLFFAVHVAAGWRNALRLAREEIPAGFLPQSTNLGLTAGCLAAAVALGVHAFFDYSLRIPAVAMLAALCAGWLAGARGGCTGDQPWWIRILAMMPLVPGLALAFSVIREGPAENIALQAENKLVAADYGAAWDLAMEGLKLRPSNPRLLMLAGESAAFLGNAETDGPMRIEWYGRAEQYFSEFLRVRPYFAHGLRERALALDALGRHEEALPLHLRAIGRDPDHARGYEYLAIGYWRSGRTEEAQRLFRLSLHLTGSRLAGPRLQALQNGERSF